jgi:hypothetical protein
MAARATTGLPQFSLVHLLLVTTLVAVAFATLPTVWALRAAYWVVLIFGLSILFRLYDGPRTDVSLDAPERRLVVRPSRKYLAYSAACVLGCAIGFPGFEVGYWLLSWSGVLGDQSSRTDSDAILLIISSVAAGPFFVATLAYAGSFVSDWFNWIAFDKDRQSVEVRGKTVASLADVTHIELRELPDDPDAIWDGLALDYVYSVRIIRRPSAASEPDSTGAIPLTGQIDLLEAQYVAQSLAKFLDAPVRVACEAVL